MILRGDGHTGIVKGDCFTNRTFPIGKGSILIGNPPFPHEKTDDPPEKFVERGLEALATRGTLAMIVPSSLMVKPSKKTWRTKILRNNSLKGVITLPPELFQPYAAATTSIILLEKGVAHTKNTKTFFCRIENDGYRIKKSVRIEQPGEQLSQAVTAYLAGDSIPGFCTVTAWTGGEWSPGAYIKAAAHTTDQLKKEISGLIRSQVGFHAHYAPELSQFGKLLAEGELRATPYGKMTGSRTGRHGNDDLERVGGLFDIFYGQKSLHNKENLRQGSSLVISSAASDNGCYGFFDFGTLIAPPPSNNSKHGKHWRGLCSNVLEVACKRRIRHEHVELKSTVIIFCSLEFTKFFPAFVVGIAPILLLCRFVPLFPVERIQMQDVRFAVASNQIQATRHADTFFIKITVGRSASNTTMSARLEVSRPKVMAYSTERRETGYL